ncbi:hypothetical protein EYC59_00465 [Candidatus Saccharibacteria bacterium]|nr:MAG: hypothetical protein EYC59_00465 [Candidatus Saccharibacteria bacterium]
MSKQKTKQSSLHLSPKKIVLYIGIFLLLVIGLVHYVVFGADSIQVKSFNRQLDKVPVSSNWTLISTSNTPDGTWGTCLEYIDNPCPGATRTYSSDSQSNLPKQFSDLYNHFVTQGYATEDKCVSDECGSSSEYFFKVHKGRTAVGASVEENGSKETITIGIGHN